VEWLRNNKEPDLPKPLSIPPSTSISWLIAYSSRERLLVLSVKSKSGLLNLCALLMSELIPNSISSSGLREFAIFHIELESEFPEKETKKRELKMNSTHWFNMSMLRISLEDSPRKPKSLLDRSHLFKFTNSIHLIFKIQYLNLHANISID